MREVSRRRFVELTATGAAALPFGVPGRTAGTAAAITAHEVVERIRKQVGVEWKTETVDTFKAGDPATVVTGIATTALATIEVLRQAKKAGANLVITCEPTFYSRADTITPPARRGGSAPGNDSLLADPVFAAKNDFIKANNLVVWRFSDHWRLRKPNPLAHGLAETLGWSTLESRDDPSRVAISSITLEALASQIKKKLDARGGIRVVGNPRMEVQAVGLLPGPSPIQVALATLPIVDALVAGEVREWESVEYARDQLTAGEKKGLILLGRVLSEEPGMRVCARWLKALVPETATTWIRVGDPYWRPL